MGVNLAPVSLATGSAPGTALPNPRPVPLAQRTAASAGHGGPQPVGTYQAKLTASRLAQGVPTHRPSGTLLGAAVKPLEAAAQGVPTLPNHVAPTEVAKQVKQMNAYDSALAQLLTEQKIARGTQPPMMNSGPRRASAGAQSGKHEKPEIGRSGVRLDSLASRNPVKCSSPARQLVPVTKERESGEIMQILEEARNRRQDRLRRSQEKAQLDAQPGESRQKGGIWSRRQLPTAIQPLDEIRRQKTEEAGQEAIILRRAGVVMVSPNHYRVLHEM